MSLAIAYSFKHYLKRKKMLVRIYMPVNKFGLVYNDKVEASLFYHTKIEAAAAGFAIAG
jgi:hypothetical protein